MLRITLRRILGWIILCQKWVSLSNKRAAIYLHYTCFICMVLAYGSFPDLYHYNKTLTASSFIYSD